MRPNGSSVSERFPPSRDHRSHENMGMEKWKEANEHLTKALQLDPHNVELNQMQSMVQSKIVRLVIVKNSET